MSAARLVCCLALALWAGCPGDDKPVQRDGRFTPLKDYGQQVEQSVIDWLRPPFDLGRSEPGPTPDGGCKQGWDDCSSGTCCSPLTCCTCTCGKICKGSTTLSCNNTCINAC
jgi:hypothetical protein